MKKKVSKKITLNKISVSNLNNDEEKKINIIDT